MFFVILAAIAIVAIVAFLWVLTAYNHTRNALTIARCNADSAEEISIRTFRDSMDDIDIVEILTYILGRVRIHPKANRKFFLLQALEYAEIEITDEILKKSSAELLLLLKAAYTIDAKNTYLETAFDTFPVED